MLRGSGRAGVLGPGIRIQPQPVFLIRVHATSCSLFIVSILATTLTGPAFAKTAAKEAEYKRADTNFYWKGDVLKVDPSAEILSAGEYTQKDDSYFVATHKKAPREIYIQVVNDWIEPITPPSMPSFLNIEPDAMQIREPQGDVQVALPTAPANFVAATDGMTIPNGTVVKAGANGTAAVLFGGVDSARLSPNSEAAVQQTVAPQLRTTEIDLTMGAVFSKVGQRVGEKQDYKVHTPFGVAAARGTDFVSIAMPSRVDVWIAQGTVQLDQPDGKSVGAISAEGKGPLKIIRFPAMPDAHQTMMASAETMTAAMNFIPMVNVKVKALRDQMAQGGKLTAQEMDYLGRIKKVPCLIKLALVEPPPPLAPPPAPSAPPAVPPAPPVALPEAAPAPVPAPAASAAPVAPTTPVVVVPASPSASSNLPPLELELHPSGKADFQGATLSMAELEPRLEAVAKATPHQPLLIKASQKVTYKQIKRFLKICNDAELPVTFANAEPPPSASSAPLPAAHAHPAMAPRQVESTTPPAAQPTPPSKTTKLKPATNHTPKPVAPIATGPDATTP